MEHDADRELITRAAERARDHTRAGAPYRTPEPPSEPAPAYTWDGWSAFFAALHTVCAVPCAVAFFEWLTGNASLNGPLGLAMALFYSLFAGLNARRMRRLA